MASRAERQEAPADEPFVEVMFNTRYGGFGFSPRFKQEYNRRMRAIDLTYKPPVCVDECERDDPVAVQLLKDLGRIPSSDPHASLSFAKVPLKYKRFFIIEEYDGSESVQIDYDAYRTFHTRQILKDETIGNDAKVLKLTELMDEPLLFFKRTHRSVSQLAPSVSKSPPDVGPLADQIPQATEEEDEDEQEQSEVEEEEDCFQSISG
jgi:hypothetical protein